MLTPSAALESYLSTYLASASSSVEVGLFSSKVKLKDSTLVLPSVQQQHATNTNTNTSTASATTTGAKSSSDNGNPTSAAATSLPLPPGFLLRCVTFDSVDVTLPYSSAYGGATASVDITGVRIVVEREGHGRGEEDEKENQLYPNGSGVDDENVENMKKKRKREEKEKEIKRAERLMREKYRSGFSGDDSGNNDISAVLLNDSVSAAPKNTFLSALRSSLLATLVSKFFSSLSVRVSDVRFLLVDASGETGAGVSIEKIELTNLNVFGDGDNDDNGDDDGHHHNGDGTPKLDNLVHDIAKSLAITGIGVYLRQCPSVAKGGEGGRIVNDRRRKTEILENLFVSSSDGGGVGVAKAGPENSGYSTANDPSSRDPSSYSPSQAPSSNNPSSSSQSSISPASVSSTLRPFLPLLMSRPSDFVVQSFNVDVKMQLQSNTLLGGEEGVLNVTGSDSSGEEEDLMYRDCDELNDDGDSDNDGDDDNGDDDDDNDDSNNKAQYSRHPPLSPKNHRSSSSPSSPKRTSQNNKRNARARRPRPSRTNARPNSSSRTAAKAPQVVLKVSVPLNYQETNVAPTYLWRFVSQLN